FGTGEAASGSTADRARRGQGIDRTDMRPVERSPRPTLKRYAKDVVKRALRRCFETGQHWGFDLLPRHFYSQIPDIRELKSVGSWKDPRSMVGVQGIDRPTQFDFVETCCAPEFVAKLRQEDIHGRAGQLNGESGFGVPDAEFLYCFIR